VYLVGIGEDVVNGSSDDRGLACADVADDEDLEDQLASVLIHDGRTRRAARG
jgi:hypothetical protein